MQTKKIILEKISKLLDSKIDSEVKALYLLAEIRKILGQKETLYIFCSWALHNELNYSSTVRYFTKKFEPYIKEGVDAKSIANELKSKQGDFFKLTELKIELRKFLQQNNLPFQLTDNPRSWIMFTKFLLEIMKECPVVIQRGKIKRLSLVEDSLGNTCYRIHLRDNKHIIKIKIKFKR